MINQSIKWTIACDCNGKSTICEVDTGICLNCTGNFIGDFCQSCPRGLLDNGVECIGQRFFFLKKTCLFVCLFSCFFFTFFKTATEFFFPTLCFMQHQTRSQFMDMHLSGPLAPFVWYSCCFCLSCFYFIEEEKKGRWKRRFRWPLNWPQWPFKIMRFVNFPSNCLKSEYVSNE